MFMTIAAGVAVAYLAVSCIGRKAASSMLNDLEQRGYYAACLQRGVWQVYHAPSRTLVTMSRDQLLALHVYVMRRG